MSDGKVMEHWGNIPITVTMWDDDQKKLYSQKMIRLAADCILFNLSRTPFDSVTFFEATPLFIGRLNRGKSRSVDASHCWLGEHGTPQPWRSGTPRPGGAQTQRHEPRPMRPCDPQAYVCLGTLGVLFAS